MTAEDMVMAITGGVCKSSECGERDSNESMCGYHMATRVRLV